MVLDRDGTINRERHYLADSAALELLPGAAAGLRTMQQCGCGLVVVTNQSGIARGHLDGAALERIHDRLRALLAAEGVTLAGLFHCPHHPDDRCACRKPRTGLVRQAAQQFGFRPQEAFVIGDKACDIELGRRVGATTLLVRTGYGAKMSSAEVEALAADHIVDDLVQAAEVIERNVEERRRFVA